MYVSESQGLFNFAKHLLGHTLPPNTVSLEQYVEKFVLENPGTRVSLAVEGIEAFLR